MTLVLHDDAEREYAYAPAQGPADTKVGFFPYSQLTWQRPEFRLKYCRRSGGGQASHEGFWAKGSAGGELRLQALQIKVP
jgi:hypothetical protein